MSQRPRKRTKKSSFSGNHQRSWLWGLHAVNETLEAGIWPLLEVFATRDAFEKSRVLSQPSRSPSFRVEIVAADRLEQLCRSAEHQGLIARMGDYPYCPWSKFEQRLGEERRAQTNVPSEKVSKQASEEASGEGSGEGSEEGSEEGSVEGSVEGSEQISEQASQEDLEQISEQVFDPSPPPLIVLCDRIQDTFNFGAILRCCDGANVMGVVVGMHAQALVTPHVARSSAGAVNHITVVQAPDLVAAARSLQALGWQLVAADCNASQTAWNAPLAGRTALVIGSEAHGIRPELLEICDQQVCIPMEGKVASLNAAVATGILLYEIRRQQLAGHTRKSLI